MQNRWGFAIIILSVLILDQASKIAVSAQVGLGESVPVVPGLVHITLVRNTGMAFGLFSAHSIPYKLMREEHPELGCVSASPQ